MKPWLWLTFTSRFGVSLAFMMYAGALPYVMRAWDVSAVRAGAIQTAFNVCYALSLVASSWLADVYGARRIFLWSSWLTALNAWLFALAASSYTSAFILFGVFGVTQGGTYGPSIMLVAQGVPQARRGTAVGLLIAAASLGYFGSIALSNFVASHWGIRAAFTWCALGPLLGAVAATLSVRARPNIRRPRGKASAGALDFLTERRGALLTAGYTAHCWELLGMWAWLPAFLTAVIGTKESTQFIAPGLLIAGATHLSGVMASVAMGRTSDRFGRRRILLWIAAAGAACSFTIGWTIGAPVALVLALAALYGFLAVGDSSVLSTAMTESVDAGSLGAALGVRSILGFGAGGVAPLVFGAVLDAGGGGSWGPAFAVLGIGGVLAAIFSWLLPQDERGAA